MITIEPGAIREELRMLVEHIPDSDVATARKILRALVDPVELSLLTAPFDDEPLSGHELSALREAHQREERGEPLIAHDEILREFGLIERNAF